MPPPAVFATLGLFVRETFLSSERCAGLERAMQEASSTAAEVYGGEAAGGRSVSDLLVSPALALSIDEAIVSLIGDLECHFHARLVQPEPASFLRYRQGDHYAPHRDRPAASVDEHASRRAVSVVIFVNDHAGRHGFEGGFLRFYGLLGAGHAELGMDLQPKAGTLIAFESGLLHEVTPVTSGTRYSIAAWLLSDTAPGGETEPSRDRDGS